MISTAIALQNVTKEAVHDEIIMNMARAIYHTKDGMSPDEFAQALYMYSGTLAALTTTLVTSVLLTEAEIDDMVNTIKEMETMGKDVE
jgi:DNA polymerase elongation subunit (family B)